MNLSVAIMAGGALRLVLDAKSVVASVMSFVFGSYMLFTAILIARNIERKD